MSQDLWEPEKPQNPKKHYFLAGVHFVSEEQIVQWYPSYEIYEKLEGLYVIHCNFPARRHILIRLWIEELLKEVENHVKEENNDHCHIKPELKFPLRWPKRSKKCICHNKANCTQDDYNIEYLLPIGFLTDDQRIEKLGDGANLSVGIFHVICDNHLFQILLLFFLFVIPIS